MTSCLSTTHQSLASPWTNLVLSNRGCSLPCRHNRHRIGYLRNCFSGFRNRIYCVYDHGSSISSQRETATTGIQLHCDIESIKMELYSDSKISCWWDLSTCPVINYNDSVVVNNIQKAIKDKGHHGSISINAFGRIEHLPLSVKLPVYKFLRSHDNGEMMMESLALWAQSHPPPTSVLLISGSNNLNPYLKELNDGGYKIMVVKPRSAFELKPDDPWLFETWETVSIGVDSSSSVYPYIFDRNSLLVVEQIFNYLHDQIGSNQASFTPTKGKPTVVIIFRDKGSKTTNTSLKYASYYQNMGWKPTLVCADMPSALDVLTRNADVAEIPFFGIRTGSNLKETVLNKIQSRIKSCRELHDLIIVDISISVNLDDPDDYSFEKRVYQVSKALKTDFVLFAVKPSCIQHVYRLVDAPALVINIEENITNNELILREFTWTDAPILFVQKGSKFEAVDLKKIVLLFLGACKFTTFVDEYALQLMDSYCKEMKERLCPRHSEISNEVMDAELGLPNDQPPNKILKAAYRLWYSTLVYENETKDERGKKGMKEASICEDCSRGIREWRANI